MTFFDLRTDNQIDEVSYLEGREASVEETCSGCM